MITLNDGRKVLYQWDTGRRATVDVECDKVHFSNTTFGKAINVDVVDGQVAIPDELLTSGSPLLAWAFVGDAEQGFTKKEQKFDVIKRAKPSDYVFTPAEQITLDKILQKMGNLDNLHTVDKSSLVNAINEVLINANQGGKKEIEWVGVADEENMKATHTASEIIEMLNEGIFVVAKFTVAEAEFNQSIIATPILTAYGEDGLSLVAFGGMYGLEYFIGIVDDEGNIEINTEETHNPVKRVNNIPPDVNGNIYLTPGNIGAVPQTEFDNLKNIVTNSNTLLQLTLEGGLNNGY